MVEIRNKLNQRLVINLISGTIDVLAKSTAVISDSDFSSSHLQNLLRSGKVIRVSQIEEKSKKRWPPKKVESPKKKVSEPEMVSEPENIAESEISETGKSAEPEVSDIETKPDESAEKPESEAEEMREWERNKPVHNKRRK